MHSTRTGNSCDETPPGRSQTYVDYEHVAALYRRGRTLPTEVLARWANALRQHLPARDAVVLDVGAGTGVFTEALTDWTGGTVVSVEPAAAMIRAAAPIDA